MKISDFYDKEYINFAIYDSYRSIGNYIDGLKPSARKVINSITKRKSTKEEKVSIFVSDVARENEYIHGATSLEGVVIGMAQNFCGSNNINLLLPEGSFGTRTIQSSAASRYIFTKKNNIIDKIFIDLDKSILISQEFEGTIIEPRFYIPIVPMILINGNEGIGNGFAQKILSRNVLEIIDILEDKLTNKKRHSTPTELLPHFKDFKGTIKRLDGFSYEIIGNFERTNTTTITITELPVGYDLEKYNKILSKLEEDKVINDFTDKSEDNTFLFELKVSREFTKKDDDYILDKLKLIRRVTENFTCIGENNQIVEFTSDTEILDAFIKIRLLYYEKRKLYQIQKLKEELLYLGAKYFFIKEILSDKIIINKNSKIQIETQIKNNKAFPFDSFEDFSFLINMPIHSLSIETFNELKKIIDIKKELLFNIQNKKIQDIWLTELRELKKILKK
ncbi:hypothetical protein GW796_05745 [archaeon]|nr:hypothetical protein [archaeon]NCQ51387.1 hypothetical protein [archaeon]NCT58787.1 hypothetical protein [archaeon]